MPCAADGLSLYRDIGGGVMENGRVAIPMTVKAQLLEARRLGHELSTVRRDFGGDIPPKIKVKCTCGYESTFRRSEKAVAATVVWHLGKVLGNADSSSPTRRAEMHRNGILPRQASGL